MTFWCGESSQALKKSFWSAGWPAAGSKKVQTRTGWSAVALERGRKPEIDWLNGEIVRRGAEHGVPTPLNRELVALVHDIAAKRARPGLESLYGVYLRLESGQLGAAPVGPSLTTQRTDSQPTSIQLE